MLLKEYIAHGINNKHLAVLSDNSLSGAGSDRRIARRRLGVVLGSGLASLLGHGLETFLAVLLFLLLLHVTSLLAVYGLGHTLVVFLGLRGRRSSIDVKTRNVTAPGSVAGKSNVAADEFSLALPARVQDDVVHATTDEQKQAEHDCTQTRAVAVVVVVGTFPQREAIGEEMVVTVSGRAAQDVGNQRQASLTF